MYIRRLMVQAGFLSAIGLVAACGGEAEQEVAPVEEVEAPADAAPVVEPGVEPGVAPPSGAAAGGVQAAAAGDLPPGVTPEMVQQGQQLFHGQGICFTCHGQNGQGTTLGPNLNDSEWLWITGSGPEIYDQIVQTVRTGVSQPKEHPAPMPAMGGAQLDDEQLRAVSAYVYSISQGG